MRVGESGIQHRIDMLFDMSLNTSLDFVYTKPITKTTLAVIGVLGTTQETIDGVVTAANFWCFYDFDVGDVDEAGEWELNITYNNTVPAPDDVFKNQTPIKFTVDA